MGKSRPRILGRNRQCIVRQRHIRRSRLVSRTARTPQRAHKHNVTTDKAGAHRPLSLGVVSDTALIHLDKQPEQPACTGAHARLDQRLVAKAEGGDVVFLGGGG